MRRLILCSLIAATVLPASVASAGGWATAGVGPPPDGMSGGDTWNAQVTILQHGQTPLVGLKPTLTIRNDAGKAVTFPAKPTGKPGVYVAKVRFPSGGTWRYEVFDGFTQYGGQKTHTFGPVTLSGSGAGDDSSFPLLPSLGGAALVLAAAAALVFLIRRQRRTAPAPA